MPRRPLLSIFLVVAACGGRDADVAPASNDGAGANTKANAAPATGCETACRRWATCVGWREDTCVSGCTTEFPDPAKAKIYGDCIASLSCEELEESTVRNAGPDVQCHAAARGR